MWDVTITPPTLQSGKVNFKVARRLRFGVLTVERKPIFERYGFPHLLVLL